MSDTWTIAEIQRDFDMGNKALWEHAPEYIEALLGELAAERKRREEAEVTVERQYQALESTARQLDAMGALERRAEQAEALAYIGDLRFPDLTRKARCEELVSDLRKAERERDEARLRAKYAETLADEVAVLVRRKIIDSRSPAADALLDFRDPPSSERADRMALLEGRAERAEADNAALLAEMKEAHDNIESISGDVFERAHPGAALLERMRALEDVAHGAAEGGCEEMPGPCGDCLACNARKALQVVE